MALWRRVRKSLNFYRIHLLFFTFTPLIFAAIFFASNGEFHVSFIDALFLCVSAITVTGLATLDLSSLTGWQQAILFFLSSIGNTVIVSWVMVYIRRKYFALKFKHVVEATLAQRAGQSPDAEKYSRSSAWAHRLTRVLNRKDQMSTVDEMGSSEEKGKHTDVFNKGALRNLRPDMVRRMDDAPKPIDPNGWVTENNADAPGEVQPMNVVRVTTESSKEEPQSDLISNNGVPSSFRRTEIMSESPEGSRSRTLSKAAQDTSRSSTSQQGHGYGIPFPDGRTHTVEFKNPEIRAHRNSSTVSQHHRRSTSEAGHRRPSLEPWNGDNRHVGLGYGAPVHRTATMHTHRSVRSAMHTGYGGFPGPHTLLLRLFMNLFPSVQRRFVRHVTIPRTTTLQSAHGPPREGVKTVQYITFDAIVGRNSKFHMLTDENLEELGGVEYRALSALLWIIGGYHIGLQLLSFIVIAPYISAGKWRSNFEPPQLHRYVPPTWFAAFQVVSAYTNSGMSLVDQSMVPFQRAYPMIVFMVICILAGNTAFPIFLRFLIWIITKLYPTRSRANETLHFLLDHPRRCFIYLFPSHQTWFLLTVVVVLNMTDWFFFLVLDIGNPAMESVPIGVRFIIGLLQATAVRAAGFGTVTLSSLTPAVQVLYVMMMYISVYPIAMSVRSTNVYEERSLGVFEDQGEELETEPSPAGPRVAVWGRYLAWHARKQLAFDMWWLGLALFLVCIIERAQIINQDNLSWFTIFSVVFELISAYGTVGLSLGVPFGNFSLSGAFSPLSKLIVCAVMLRGRHRGLPVAIDRAIMLPFEYPAKEEQQERDMDAPGPRGSQVKAETGGAR